MSNLTLFIPDPHAHPDFGNERADWLGKLIKDLKPDTVICIGDLWDLHSLSDFEKGKASFVGRSYEKDIEAGLDFNDRLWHPLKKAKKGMPKRYFFEGNHEHRIAKALDRNPELNSMGGHGIAYSHLDIYRYWDEFIPYSGSVPGSKIIDGVLYAHFLPSGLMGKASSGLHHAHSLLTQNHCSCTVAHSHKFDFKISTNTQGATIQGLVAGCYQDYNNPWAGDLANQWWRGVIIKRNVSDGVYDLETVSLEKLKRVYGEG